MPRKTTCCKCGKERDGAHLSYCKLCAAQYNRARYAKDPEKQKLYQIEWWRNNRDKAKRYKKKSTLKSQYGLTLEEYEAMTISQNGKCAICEQPPPDGLILYVDHDHTTGRVRDLLCVKCNFAIGQLGDDVQVARKLIAYLERHATNKESTGGKE